MFTISSLFKKESKLQKPVKGIKQEIATTENKNVKLEYKTVIEYLPDMIIRHILETEELALVRYKNIISR